MDPTTVRAWRDRWQAVALIEREERRALTPEERWRRLNLLYRSIKALGLSYERSAREQAEIERVRLQWITLKRGAP